MIDTINIVSKELAKESIHSEIVIRKINSFYWKNLAQEIYAGKNMALRIKSIGSFTVSRYKLYKKIKNTITTIRNTQKEDFKLRRGVIKEEYVNKLYFNLRTLLRLRNKLALHYQKSGRYI